MKSLEPAAIPASTTERAATPAPMRSFALFPWGSWLSSREGGPRVFCRLLLVCLVCLVAATFSACSLKSKTRPNVSGPAISQSALSTLGTPYRSGGTSPSRGFDCSGLVLWAYARHGFNVPRTAKAQSGVGSAVGKGALQKGDIVVFKTRSGIHTGIYTGGGKFVHSPSRGKTVRVDRLDSEYWSRRIVSGRRV